MTAKNYAILAASIFAIVAILQLARALWWARSIYLRARVGSRGSWQAHLRSWASQPVIADPDDVAHQAVGWNSLSIDTFPAPPVSGSARHRTAQRVSCRRCRVCQPGAAKIH